MVNRSNLVFLAVGRVFALVILGLGFFLGGQNPSLFLWGLLIEEFVTLVSLTIRQGILTAKTGNRAASPMGIYFVFPFAHAIFILIFTFMAAVAFAMPEGSQRVPPPRMTDLRNILLAFSAWAVFDIIRWGLKAKRGKLSAEEGQAIDLEARMALFLPHITIIAGGFCMIMLKLGSWMAWGIIAGRLLFEVLSFSMAVSKARNTSVAEVQD